MVKEKQSSASGSAHRKVVYPISASSVARVFRHIQSSRAPVPVYLDLYGNVRLDNKGYKHVSEVGVYNHDALFDRFIEDVFHTAEHDVAFRAGQILRLIVAGTNSLKKLSLATTLTVPALQHLMDFLKRNGWVRHYRLGQGSIWEECIDETYLVAPSSDS